MARRYKRKRNTRTRRRTRRFKRRPRRRMRIITRRMGRLNPDAIFVKLVWQRNEQLTSALSFHTVALNDVHHPNVTDATDNSQPPGFDAWNILYTNHQVMGSRCVARVTNASISQSFNAILFPSMEPDPGVGFIDSAGQKYAKLRYVSPSTGGMPLALLKSYMTTRKLIGRNTNDLNYVGNASTGPSALFFWKVVLQGLVDPPIAINAFVSFRVTYYVKFWQRQVIVDA